MEKRERQRKQEREKNVRKLLCTGTIFYKQRWRQTPWGSPFWNACNQPWYILLLVIPNTVIYNTSCHAKNNIVMMQGFAGVTYMFINFLRHTGILVLWSRMAVNKELLLLFTFPAAASWTLLKLSLRGGRGSLCVFGCSAGLFILIVVPLPKHKIERE